MVDKMVDKNLTREAILARNNLAEETVDVPEWGGKVRVRELTGAQRDAWEAAFLSPQGDVRENFMVGARARLVALAAVDAAGERLFRDEDVQALSAMPARGLNRVFSAASRLSGLSQNDLAELEGNLRGAHGADSGSV